MKFLSEELKIWNYGVLSCPDLFMTLFQESINHISEEFIAGGGE
jgi:hypothetical protein